MNKTEMKILKKSKLIFKPANGHDCDNYSSVLFMDIINSDKIVLYRLLKIKCV